MKILTVNEYNIQQTKHFNDMAGMYDFKAYPNEYRPTLEKYLASYNGVLLKAGYVAIEDNLHICRSTKEEAMRVLKEYLKERKAWPNFKEV